MSGAIAGGIAPLKQLWVSLKADLFLIWGRELLYSGR